MLVDERACRLIVLVAWIWAWFSCYVQARKSCNDTRTQDIIASLTRRLSGPQLSPGSSPALVAGPFANSSKTPSPTDGSCGKCGIEAPGGIRLVYWEPDGAVSKGSNITTPNNGGQEYTQIDNGFTYTSPSVYVIYSSLRATATCSDSALHTIGPSFSKKTIAYSSRFLAYGTLSMPDAGCSEFVVVGGFHTIDFSSLFYNPITTTTTSKGGCAPYVNPRLSLPAELTNVDPSWQSCEPLFYGAFDPPSVLTKASGGLVPSSVGAGQVTDPALAQGSPSPLSAAQPVVTPPPPVAAPTGDAPVNNGLPPATPSAEPQALASANQAPADQSSEQPPNSGQAGSTPVKAGGSNPTDEETQPEHQAAPPASSQPALGKLIYNPLTGNSGNDVAKPAPGGSPAVAANPEDSPALVAVPVDTGTGKPAYAVVAAEPHASGGTSGPVAAVPFPGASSNQQGSASSEQSAPASGNLAPARMGDGGGNRPVTPGGNSQPPGVPNGNGNGRIPDENGNAAGTGPSNGALGTTKVTFNDGSTADIPTVDIFEPDKPQDGVADGLVSPSGLHTVHLSSGAFLPIPGASGSSSSVAVQDGDYLVPEPIADRQQQTLTLQGGQIITVPIDLPQSVTLQGGQVTQISGNNSPQTLMLQNGQVSTISPTPYTSVTLANNQITAMPIPGALAENGADSINTPLKILTLQDGRLTTVPIATLAQIATLQNGKVTTIPANAPPQIITLQNGAVSTISPTPYTTVTLANGEVTSIPMGHDTLGGDDAFIEVPDGTVSGSVHYTRLPIADLLPNTALQATGVGANGSVSASGLLSASPSMTGTAAGPMSTTTSAQVAASTTSGNITPSATRSKTASSAPPLRPGWGDTWFWSAMSLSLCLSLALVCWGNVT